MTTGMDLKIRRIRRRVTTKALAQAGGWRNRERISQIESMAVVPEDTARRYMDALLTFPDVITAPEVA